MLTSAKDIRKSYKIDEKIMEILDEDAANEEYILEKIKEDKFADFNGKNIYSALLRVFTSLDFVESEAEIIWGEIIEYKKDLSKELHRDVGFRVAMLDYFININKKLINPKIIEIRLFAETERLVLIDELTKLYNRRHFQNSIQREFKQAKRYSQPLSMLMIDIDNFKKINDTYGHVKGDEILIEMGKVLISSMREEDTSCRIGGEEFAVILPQTNEEQALIASDKLLEAFRKVKIGGKSVTFSGGIASFPVKAISANEMYDFADRALYYAKYSGKNRVVAYSDNKRGNLRFNANLEILFELPDKTIRTVSNNVSITGIAFETEDDLNLLEVIDAKLKDITSGEEIFTKLKIVRKEKLEGNSFRIGAEFFDQTSNGRKILSELFLLEYKEV